MTRTLFSMSVVACVLLSGCAKHSGMLHAKSAKDRPIFVVLYMKDNVCTPIAGEDAVPVHKGDKVVWEIFNACTNADQQEVVFEKFKDKSNEQPKNPMEGNSPYSKIVTRGQIDTKKVNVKTTADPIRYKYDIRVVNGGTLDPELEIEP